MARASKGPRQRVVSRVPNELYEILDHNRRAAGVGSISQFVADVLASHFDRSDLVWELEPDLLSVST